LLETRENDSEMILVGKMVEFGVILLGRMMNGMILMGKVKEEAFGMNLRVFLKKKCSQ
jgi:hypothetical protein